MNIFKRINRIMRENGGVYLLPLLICLVAFGLDFAFLLSKNAFYPSATIAKKAVILINSIAIIFLPIVSLILFLSVLVARLDPLYKRLFDRTIVLIFFLSAVASAFVHIDIFVLSTFGNNVVDLPLAANWLLMVSLVAVAIWLSRVHFNSLLSWANKVSIIVVPATVIFVITLCASGIYEYTDVSKAFEDAPVLQGNSSKSPNVIIFSSDGLNNNGMSVYGYARNNTPNLKHLAQKSIVYTRAYTNCSHSRCSDASTLTGKHPVETKLIFFPEIYMGRDSFEHLPGILAIN
jgi:hypothetical protein